jgi:hypothetical protein
MESNPTHLITRFRNPGVVTKCIYKTRLFLQLTNGCANGQVPGLDTGIQLLA